MKGLGKVTAVFLALTIALAGVGVGFAAWTDTLTINGTVNTGTVSVGIHNESTNDPGATADPQWGAGHNTEGKNVASITSEDTGDPVCTKGAIDFHEGVKFTISNAYPYYAPGGTILIANCGSIPMKVDTITVTIVEKDASGNPVYDGTWNSTTGFDPALGSGTMLDDIRLVSWTINGQSGVGVASLLAALPAYSQIEPCSYISITAQIGFEEGETGDLLPQGHTLTFNVTVTCSQWNEVD